MLATVFLYGKLGDKYGRRFELAVHSAAEAVALLAANFRAFRGDLLACRHGLLIKVDGRAVGDLGGLREQHLAPEIHIVPVIAGAGGDNNGAGLVVVAAAIAVAAYTGYIPADFVGAAYNVALNLAVSGVSQMLMAGAVQPEAGNSDLTGETNKVSYAFNGPVNTTAQGNPVPVLYGQLLIGSQVVSAGIEVQ